jgi:hypothetical protein
MKIRFWVLVPFLILATALLAVSQNLNKEGKTKVTTPSKDSQPATPVNTDTQPATLVTAPDKSSSYSKALILHKPKPNPAWGRLIQYRKEQASSLSEKSGESRYEFIFQDDQGVLRTAVFHENPSGDNYWEVLVWDQP